jgi:formate C-acetyltransferase
MFPERILSRRGFLRAAGATAGAAAVCDWSPPAYGAAPTSASPPDVVALRQAIVNSPVRVALHRAQVFTKVFRETEDRPWIVRKAQALREYFQTVPLYLREHDRLAGAISETPGAMPVIVELGIGENGIYTSERPDRQGYLRGQVPDEIREYWKNRNMYGRYRSVILEQKPFSHAGEVPPTLNYKFLSNQGHLSPSYSELLRRGLGGMLQRVQTRRPDAANPDQTAFLAAAELALTGVSAWARRYAEFLTGEAPRAGSARRAAELREMAQIAEGVAGRPPETFREALQLIWFIHQAIHIEGHGYSCTPDRIDQLLCPFYEADRRAGRLDDAQAVRLIENFVLKMYDNSFWGPEHHLTQGLCVGGSTPDGDDQTNRLSWLFVEAATNLALPEPLVWIRWHPRIDQRFFDFCLSRLERSTCFPMIWSDKAVPAALMELGVSRADAFNFVPVGCNELALPGQMYFNPGAHAGYLPAIEAALSGGRGYRGQWKWKDVAPPPGELAAFDQFVAAVGAYLRRGIEQSYKTECQHLQAQMRWGQTPLTSCFFDGCIDKAQDLTAGTKYNILSCGGIAFANAVDCLAAVREVVYEQRAATLAEVAQACAADFQGHERLRAKLLAAPKHGNDDPRLEEIIRVVERLRDEPVKDICRDPRDGTLMGNSHVVRSGAVKQGLVTPATPDGRRAGTPLASSVAASVGCERNGPTAVLNSVCALRGTRSWQCGYQVNIRFHADMIADSAQRDQLRSLLNVYFANGGQELQINVVSSDTLRAAQRDPEQYRDLVVRVAGFSEFFVNLTPEMQEDIIARTEHR